MLITNPDELVKAVIMAISEHDPKKIEAIQAIATYKWYNYYQSMHIKAGSIEDKHNEHIFEYIESTHVGMHRQIENLINGYIDRLNSDVDD